MKLITAIVGATLALSLGLSAIQVQETTKQEGQKVVEAALQAAPKADVKEAAATAKAAMIARQMPTYPLNTCIISGEEFTEEMGDPIDLLIGDRLVRLCCESCIAEVKKAPETHMATLDQAIIAAQLPNYPLTTCPISGNELGDGVNVVHGTRLVRFCCDDCATTGFEKDPSVVMAALDAAYIAAQAPTYALTTCIISGEELGSMGDPVDMLYGNELVRLCCKGCVKGFWKTPAKNAAILHKHKMEAHKAAGHDAAKEHGTKEHAGH